MFEKLVFFKVVFLFSIFPSLFASSFDRDPISQTQTRGVPATEETAKNNKKGAPAPSFKIQDDTGRFMTRAPVEEIHKKKKSKWSIFGNDNSREEKEGGDEEGWDRLPISRNADSPT